MSSSDELEDLLSQHRSLQQLMPRAWNPFFASFGSLRPVQLKAMPQILTGKDVLVTAPTAGGKTQAVVAPVCERLAKEKWRGLSVLIVTPTRALVNDLYHRLLRPLSDMQIRLARRTAEYGLSDSHSDQVVITTPESVESLLTFQRERLANVRAVILDEIHLLDGSPRGDQLRMVLQRLRTLRLSEKNSPPTMFQRVAMSATIADPRRLADVYLGRDALLVNIGGQREIMARVIDAPGDLQSRAQAAVEEIPKFGDVRKVLVFVNSRQHVDEGVACFRTGPFAATPVYGHHGNLSREERERTEERFKSDRQAICVATMTLEVGIDIGDIDLVVCMDPPFSLAAFLQRIGRGCRRLNGGTRVLCVSRDRSSKLIFEALLRQAQQGVPRGPVAPFRRSVLLQQVLAYLRQVPSHRRVQKQFEKVFCSDAVPRVDRRFIESLLQGMVEERLLDCQNKIYRPASEGWSFIESNRIYTNIQPTPPEIELVDANTGKTIASVADVRQTSGVLIAGRSYEILPGSSARKKRVLSSSENPEAPKYHAVNLPYAFDIGAALANRFRVPPDTLAVLSNGPDVVVMTWLGQLLNAALVHSLRELNISASAGPFHLYFSDKPATHVLSLVCEAADRALKHNPLSALAVESMVDVGPHFGLLSRGQQAAAREDWLDSHFLTQWKDGLKNVRRLDAASPEAEDLFELTKVKRAFDKKK